MKRYPGPALSTAHLARLDELATRTMRNRQQVIRALLAQVASDRPDLLDSATTPPYAPRVSLDADAHAQLAILARQLGTSQRLALEALIDQASAAAPAAVIPQTISILRPPRYSAERQAHPNRPNRGHTPTEGRRQMRHAMVMDAEAQDRLNELASATGRSKRDLVRLLIMQATVQTSRDVTLGAGPILSRIRRALPGQEHQ